MAISYEDTTCLTTVQGRTVHTNELGDGPFLVCLHGGGPGANAWDNLKPNVAALSEYFRLVLLNLPGYGQSEPMDAREGETSDRMLARAMLEFMDERGIERAHLYATSASTGPAVRLALDEPSRVGKLILKSPGLGGPSLLSASPPEGIKALRSFREEPTYENMVKMMRLFVPRPEKLTEEMIQDRFKSATEALANTRKVIEPLPQSFLLAEVGKLQAPVLVVWGRQDFMVPLDGALLALGAIPNVRLHVWGGGTGHFVEWEHPEEFNRLALDFLRFD